MRNIMVRNIDATTKHVYCHAAPQCRGSRKYKKVGLSCPSARCPMDDVTNFFIHRVTSGLPSIPLFDPGFCHTLQPTSHALVISPSFFLAILHVAYSTQLRHTKMPEKKEFILVTCFMVNSVSVSGAACLQLRHDQSTSG